MKRILALFLCLVLALGTLTGLSLTETLRYGDESTDVLRAQVYLRTLSYYAGPLDGKFGYSTYNAVIAFQQRNGLSVTGLVDTYMMTRLAAADSIPAAATPPASTVLFSGSTGTQVTRAQVRLNDLGYYGGAIDGKFGYQTMAAVVRFQQVNGLTVDGKIGPATAARLYADTAIANSPAPAALSTTPLSFGMVSPEVAQAQARLKALQYYSGLLDGKFGTATRSAVVAFQRTNALYPDGVIGTKTRALLYSAGALAAGNVPLLPGGELWRGVEGTEVALAQSRLKELGYFSGLVDGKFGGDTYDAVRGFQAANALTVNGKVDAATRSKLYSAGAVAKAGAVIPPSEIKLGSLGPAVTQAQTRLRALKYYSGAVNGIFAEALETAVKAFQTVCGLPVTGIINDATRVKLYDPATVINPAYVFPAGNVLQLGDTGPEVVQAQDRLRILRYYLGSSDGVFGAGTAAAVAAFQADNALAASGILDVAARSRLYDPAALVNPLSLTPTATDLKVGDSGTQVMQAQLRLAALGYFTGVSDGLFNYETYYAVMAFQGGNGLAIDGRINNATQTKLFSDAAVPAPAAPVDIPSVENVLKIGSQGEEVSMAQAKLKALGYYAGLIDGIYGASTYYAVGGFQGVSGLPVTGKINDATRAQLYALAAATMVPGATLVPVGTPQPEWMVVRFNDVGASVIQAQTRLKELGYYSGGITGQFDYLTYLAVKAFQAANGLVIDGAIGQNTHDKLYAGTPITPFPSVSPTPAVTAVPTFRPIKFEDVGQDVIDIQTRLRDLGYFTDLIDGKFGYRTYKAVRAFQTANGLTSDGVIGPLTYDILFSPEAK
ncbi:MAG: peptidoglycan-binding protein [Christensenellales bacterium]